ncbi:Hypothetical protein NTJ_13614 [Nesidiocoris tenuis]|uniref:Uncharacterized protein n=1 Tax=Nesidiocoris tenuis TaxID=355587 RepID=A0ABN7B8T3_9HEMI|nr:Hypothetical protein NTJ_13614 [Nesidiocoris tenuis]
MLSLRASVEQYMQTRRRCGFIYLGLGRGSNVLDASRVRAIIDCSRTFGTSRERAAPPTVEKEWTLGLRATMLAIW